MKAPIKLNFLKKNKTRLPENFESSVWNRIDARKSETLVPWVEKATDLAQVIWKAMPATIIFAALFVGTGLGILGGLDRSTSASAGQAAAYSSMINPSDENPYL
jgi:hypothetical protein